MTDKRIIYSSSSAHIRPPSSVLRLQLAACPPWINVVYLVYSLITHVYFKSTTFLQGATDQAGMLRDTVCGAFFQRYRSARLTIHHNNSQLIFPATPEEMTQL